MISLVAFCCCYKLKQCNSYSAQLKLRKSPKITGEKSRLLRDKSRFLVEKLSVILHQNFNPEAFVQTLKCAAANL